MTILGVRRLLYLGVVLAGGVALAAWGLAFGLPLESLPSDVGLRSNALPAAAGPSEAPKVIELARFENRQLQRPVIDPPKIVAPPPVVVAAPPPQPMVQLPPQLQLTGVLVGSAPNTGTAFLRMGPSPAEVVRIGEAMKALPEVVVTALTRESATVRYQGQQFTLKIVPAGSTLFRKGE